MYHFCTYFDKNYLSRGIALYFSLVKHVKNFKLYVLCLDDKTYGVLKKLDYVHVKLIQLEELESYFPELDAAKKNRSVVEYYWTLTPFLPKYLLNKSNNINIITYLDADLFFYLKPDLIYEELADNSVLIVPHGLKKGDIEAENNWGKFNVGLMMFKNNQNANNIIEWWANKCLEWCYYKVEEDRAGDQKYLDYFPELFAGVIISSHIGARIGGWNIHYYKYRKKKQGFIVLPSKDPLIYCHFNKVVINDSSWILNETKGYNHKSILLPYANSLSIAMKDIRGIDKNYKYGCEKIDLRSTIVGLFKRQFVKGNSDLR